MALIDKFHNFKDCYGSSKIYDVYYNQDIDDSIIYLESRNGNDFTGNIFRIAEELSKDKFKHFKIFVFANENVKAKINELNENYDLNIHRIVTDESDACRIMEKAKYIFTDSGLRAKFVKRDGQVIVNTWHGTPLKLMGFDNPPERPNIGIIQKSLLNSDYLIYPNDYMKDIMLKAYMIDKIYLGEIILEGYPRNSVFLELDRRDEFKRMLSLQDYEIFVYMPTFKGVLSDRKDEEQKNVVTSFLRQMDSNLKDTQILFVKFHPYNQSRIDFSQFKHIDRFPSGYETYDLLNMADVLVTDYSSVFFDFANTGRKIIIFNYDEAEYVSYRGLYIPLEELPFPKVQNTSDLIRELNSPKGYDDEEFRHEFCRYDSIDSAERICRIAVNGERASSHEAIENSSKNILIYVGGMKNDARLNRLIQSIGNEDLTGHNIFLAFKAWDRNLKENYPKIFKRIPDDVQFLPLSHNLFPTISEKLDLNRFIKNNGEVPETLRNLFRRSFKRQYGDLNFDKVIVFDADGIAESLTFAFSGLDNAIVYNDDANENIIGLFDNAYELNGELKIREIIEK